MDMLGVGKVFDVNAVGDDRCTAAPCTSPDQVADVKPTYWLCLKPQTSEIHYHCCFLFLYEVLFGSEEDEDIDECLGNRDAMVGGGM